MKPIVMRPPLGDEPIEPRIEKNDSQKLGIAKISLENSSFSNIGFKV